MSTTQAEHVLKFGQNLRGRVALVTGSSRGIGAACAYRLAEHGANVVIHHVSQGTTQQAVDIAEACFKLGVRTMVVKADLTKPKEVEHIFEQIMQALGRIDIVYSNAGKEHWGKPDEVTEQQIDDTLAVNLKGQYYVAQMAYKYMSENGRLIFISSISAHRSVPAHSIYAASKAAVEGMARSLASDFGNRGITVNVVAPGGVKSDMFNENAHKYIPGGGKLSSAQLEEHLSSWSPLKRVGLPQDVAGAVALLASEEAQWITGQVIHCSGGAHMGS